MQIAEQFAAAGLGVFPCRTDKTPAIAKGTDWRKEAQRPTGEHRWPSQVVGLPVPPGVMIIDLDTYKGATREGVEQALGVTLPWDQAIIQTTQHGGQHYAFACDWAPINGSNIGGVKGLDVRAAGKGYIATGQPYYTWQGLTPFILSTPAALPRIPDACRAVMEHVKHERTAPVELPAGDRDIETLKAALAYLDPGRLRSEWVRIGLALRHHFHDNPEQGLALFDQWSSGALSGDTPDNYDPDVMEHQWYSFKPENGDATTTVGTIYHEAVGAGWQPPATLDVSAVFGAGATDIDTYTAMVDDITANGSNPKETQRLITAITGNPLQVQTLNAVLQRELKEAGLLTPELRKALTNKPIAVPRPAPTPQGQITPAEVPLPPEAWAAFQTKGKEQKPKGTYDNFKIMCEMYGVNVRYNEIGKEVKITGPGVPDGGVLLEEAALAHMTHLANLNEYPKSDIAGMLVRLANDHVYNPALAVISAQAWDTRDHINELFNCLILDEDEDRDIAAGLFRKWILGAAAIGSGFTSKFEYVLTLVDPNGGSGKTRFFNTLAPIELLQDGVILDLSDKDSLIDATSYWLVELGELDGTFSRSSNAKLKAFLSKDRDVVRMPYGKAYIKYPRRTAYMASVNKPEFLVDESGNRRFWPIRVTGADHTHGVDMYQVWAQARAALEAGETWYLSREQNDTITKRNREFRQRSEVADMLNVCIQPGEAAYHLNVTEILRKIGYHNPHKGQLNEVANWLREEGYREAKVAGKKGFYLPAVVPPTSAEAFTVHQGGKTA